MKVASMLDDVMRSLTQRPITQQYPVVRTATPDRLRGHLSWAPTGCTGCALCTKDCPADAIKLITVDKATKQFIFEYSVDKCIFCGQCVESCRFDCLNLDHDDWELSALSTDDFTSYLGDKANVDIVVARDAAAKTEQSAG